VPLYAITLDCSNPLLLLLQAVFSRPVIALGSDFGDSALPANLVSRSTLRQQQHRLDRHTSVGCFLLAAT
jgi:hypothetical protein